MELSMECLVHLESHFLFNGVPNVSNISTVSTGVSIGEPSSFNGEPHVSKISTVSIGVSNSEANVRAIVSEYCRYKRHVCREEYEDTLAWPNRRHETQESWPEYQHSLDLVSKRDYLSDGMMDDRKWLDLYLRVHVQRIHELKQNHVHLPNKKGELVP